jgi:hypothetical protein
LSFLSNLTFLIRYRLLDFEARIIDRFDVLINGAGETQHIGNGQAPKPFPDVF